MMLRFITFKQQSARQRLLKIFKVSYIAHFYRLHIKSNLVSVIHKYSFTRGVLKRYQDYRQTKERYKQLRNIVSFKIRTKKILDSWEGKNYLLFLKLSMLFIFAWPIKLCKSLIRAYIWISPFIRNLFKKISNGYYWLKPLIKNLITWLVKLMKIREINNEKYKR